MKLIFNPFEKYPERGLLALGLLLLALGSLAGYVLHARYDGVFDMHFTDGLHRARPFIDNTANTFALFLCLYIAGRFINAKTRPIDVLATALISRAPIYLLPLNNIGGYMHRMGQNAKLNLKTGDLNMDATDMGIMLLLSLVMLAVLVWVIVLLYNGFKTASNLKTISHKIIFAVALLVAEAISKIIIWALPY